MILRLLVVTHRWLGIVLAPLFAMWFCERHRHALRAVSAIERK